MSDDKIRITSKTASAIKNGGHPSSGGRTGSHNISQGRSRNSTVAKLWHMNKDQWNTNNISGGEMSYQYQEYPKHVYPNPDDCSNFIVVNNEEEEKLAVGGNEIIREDDERERLLAIAEVNSVQVDRRWGLSKIAKAIEDAGFDPAVNPFA